MTTRPDSALRTVLPIFALAALALLLLALAGPVAAESAQPPPLAPATLVALAAPDDTQMDRGDEVVFANGGATAARIVFSRKQDTALGCQPDGRRTVRSRPGQYLLEAGAELTCAPQRGSYRYSIYSQRNGAVREEQARLSVR